MDYISNLSKNLQQLIYLEIYKYRISKVCHGLTGLMTWVDANCILEFIRASKVFYKNSLNGLYIESFQKSSTTHLP